VTPFDAALNEAMAILARRAADVHQAPREWVVTEDLIRDIAAAAYQAGRRSLADEVDNRDAGVLPPWDPTTDGPACTCPHIALKDADGELTAAGRLPNPKCPAHGEEAPRE
jgi:hypothetical protein